MGQQGFLAEQARLQRDAGRAQQRIAGFDLHEFLDAAPLDLKIGAGVTHDARCAQMQEGRTTCAGRQCSAARSTSA